MSSEGRETFSGGCRWDANGGSTEGRETLEGEKASRRSEFSLGENVLGGEHTRDSSSLENPVHRLAKKGSKSLAGGSTLTLGLSHGKKKQLGIFSRTRRNKSPRKKMKKGDAISEKKIAKKHVLRSYQTLG